MDKIGTTSPHLLKEAIGLAVAVAMILQTLAALGQTTSLSETELSKESENPVSRLVTLPLRYEGAFDDGPYQATKDTFEIDQALVPFTLNDDWSLITRTQLPFLIVQPPKKLGDHWNSGLSNGYTTFFLSPEHGEGFYWGVGPLLYYPTTTNGLGVNKWGSGPSVGFVKKDESPWLFGAVINNIWSFGGPPAGGDRTNELLINPFVSFHFGDGWSVSTSPDIEGDWIANGGKWTVPIGGGIAKVVLVDGQPIKFAVDGYYNAIRPEASSETWIFELTMTFQFPK